MNEELFDDESQQSPCLLMRNELSKLQRQMHKEGYVSGKTEEEERQMQIGFDDGFKQGILLGRACGAFYGHIRASIAKMDGDAAARGHDGEVESLYKIFFEDIPEQKIILKSQLYSNLEEYLSRLPVNVSRYFEVYCAAVDDSGYFEWLSLNGKMS